MGLLSVYKADQGRGVRLFMALSCLVLSLWACVNLYDLITPVDMPPGSVWLDVDLLGLRFPVSGYMIPPAALFLGIALVVWHLTHRPKVAEFLIETEGELKKVSWPGRKEWINSSLAVMVVILIFVVYLYAVDTGLSALFIALKIGF